MKRLITLMVLASSLFQVAKAQDSLKIMSYNLRFGERASMVEIGEYIKSEAPDIVAVQECDWNTGRAAKYNPDGRQYTNILGSTAGMFPLYARTINFSGGYYGIGILSRYPIIRSERIFLPNPENEEQRAMLMADIELPSGKIVTFVCTHLDYVSSDTQVAQVRHILKATRHHDVVFLAGDMNAEPDSKAMTELRKKWDDLTNRDLTFSTDKPEVKIDYIYAKKGSGVELLSTRVADEVRLSDHFPIISEVVIK